MVISTLNRTALRVLRPSRAAVWTVVALALCLLVVPDPALAQDFNVDTILPAGLAGKTFLEQAITVLLIVALGGVFVMLAFGVMGGIGDVFSSLTEARARGEWGSFLKTMAFVIAVLIFAAVLAALVVKWFTGLNINPTITIGGG
ncbi:MAG: hypothetical protein IPK64_22025 [bacterium]|nr:hypothetical protein [bacterium]